VTIATTVAVKASRAVEIALTYLAWSTCTPTPAFPSGAPPCSASDLHIDMTIFALIASHQSPKYLGAFHQIYNPKFSM
jgi:hypothetical protein